MPNPPTQKNRLSFFFFWISIPKHQKNQYHSSVISGDTAGQKIPQTAEKIM